MLIIKLVLDYYYSFSLHSKYINVISFYNTNCKFDRTTYFKSRYNGRFRFGYRLLDGAKHFGIICRINGYSFDGFVKLNSFKQNKEYAELPEKY